MYRFAAALATAGLIFEEACSRCGSSEALGAAVAAGRVLVKEHSGQNYFFPSVKMGKREELISETTATKTRDASMEVADVAIDTMRSMGAALGSAEAQRGPGKHLPREHMLLPNRKLVAGLTYS